MTKLTLGTHPFLLGFEQLEQVLQAGQQVEYQTL